MTRYWVVVPYDSTQTEILDKVWEYDLREGTITIGWKELGDISAMGNPAEVRRVLDAMAPRGGYILAAAEHRGDVRSSQGVRQIP